MELFFEMDITQGQAEVIARGMLAVARAEHGIHEKEMALVKAFYGDVTGKDGTALAALENEPDIAPETVATGLSSEALARLFLKSCILLAFADGDYSPKERELVDRYAAALKVSPERVQALEQGVKEYLLGHLSKLSNVDAAVEVAKKMSV